jgi:hypothetical protein
MDRRAFIEKIIASALALGGLLFLSGCKQDRGPDKFGNQAKLWKLTGAKEKIDEPLELKYSKDTPAFYRDASLGKLDPSFVPKTGGG